MSEKLILTGLADNLTEEALSEQFMSFQTPLFYLQTKEKHSEIDYFWNFSKN